MNNKNISKLSLMTLIGFCFAAVGCGDSGTSWGGTYTVSSWTKNEASCDSEGASIAEQNSPFMNLDYCTIDLGPFGSFSAMSLVECADEVECAEPVCGEEGDTIFGVGIPFDVGNDSDGWSGESGAAGVGMGDTCNGTYASRTLKKQEDGSLRVEIKAHANFEFEKDADGYCNTDTVRELGPSEPCESLEVIILTPVAPAAE
jgi:hypothetical protein